ncbi:N-acetyltransferase [Pilimelia terevasa]|uniref:N-acetyltransferase n=1 Tax=Pilimelia terevasa TaxID=53372 RepID=A0A8J3BTL8_9ACTN|nr:GNAT family N-acetyltransferase [Pilimelia terevasa]GGK39355.1 N-acetyltransferase [Pilimelia terevasa]
MDVRSLAFRTDLALLRWGGSQIEDHGSYLVVRTPGNPTFHWGNFTLLARPPAPADMDELLAASDARFPDSRHRTFGVDGVHDQSADLAPLVRAGLALNRGAVMTAQAVHEPPRPDRTAQYRPLVTDDDWAQRVALAVACNDEISPPEYLVFAHRKAAYERGLVEAGHGAWWGAFVDGRLASAMGLFRASPGLARFQSVQTHPDLRGRGLAGTLVHRVSQYGFAELDAGTLVMVADPDYSAIRVYRSVGFTDSEHQSQVEQFDRYA